MGYYDSIKDTAVRRAKLTPGMTDTDRICTLKKEAATDIRILHMDDGLTRKGASRLANDIYGYVLAIAEIARRDKGPMSRKGYLDTIPGLTKANLRSLGLEATPQAGMDFMAAMAANALDMAVDGYQADPWQNIPKLDVTVHLENIIMYVKYMFQLHIWRIGGEPLP